MSIFSKLAEVAQSEIDGTPVGEVQALQSALEYRAAVKGFMRLACSPLDDEPFGEDDPSRNDVGFACQ